MTIADDISKYEWHSFGAVSKSVGLGQDKPEYYSKYGMVFRTKQNTRESFQASFDPFDVTVDLTATSLKWDGTKIQRAFVQPAQRPCVHFKIDQSNAGVLDPVSGKVMDPLTGKDLKPFPKNFVLVFEAQPFVEYGDNCLVSPTFEVKALGLSVSYVVQLDKSDPKRIVMYQRARWSDGYSTTYCCEAKARTA